MVDHSEETISTRPGDPTVDLSEEPAATQDAPLTRIYAGETVDSGEDPESTDISDGSPRNPARPSRVTPSRLPGGPTIPGYVIMEEIGRGGMGVVYKAWDIRLDRPVALKMILAGAHASSEQLDRFQVEAQAVARISNPGIVQIHNVGEHEGLPYFSLEFIAGGSLDDKIRGKPQPPLEAAAMVRKLALAMYQAHDRKIIHRDLKPANVLLTPEGEPKITDFGLAKRMEDDSHQTQPGAIMGTPSYMAPEQAWGQTREIGPHSDQYALGAILYTMLVGRPPFQGASALETLELARNEEPVAPTRLQPKIPVDIETICLKCLQKDPAKRFADVLVLADELERFLEGRPILARPVGWVERLVRWSRRNPKVAGLATAVAVLLIAMTAGSIVYSVRLTALNEKLVESNKAESAAKKNAQEKAIEAVEGRKAAEKAQAQEVVQRQVAEKAQTQEVVQRHKAEVELVKFERVASKLVNQNVAYLENIRSQSVLLNLRLRRVEGAQDIREELIGKTMTDVKLYVSTMADLADILADRDGGLKAKRTLAGINLQAGRLMVDFERYEEAARYFEATDKLAESMVAEFPNEIDPLKALAVIKGELGTFQLDRIGDGKAAFALYERTLAIRREIVKRLPKEDFEAQRGVCNALGAIARAYLKLGDPRKAREIYREEIEIRGQFPARFQAAIVIRSERAGLEEKLGDVCLDLNEFADARKHYEDSLDRRQKIAEAVPNDAELRRSVYLSIRKIATLDLFEHRTAEALSGYRKVLTEFERRLKVDSSSLSVKQDVALTLYYVATAELRLKDFKAAEEHYRACLTIREAMVKDPTIKNAAIDLMITMARIGQHEPASAAARKIIEVPPLDARVYYQAACGFSLCSGAVAQLPASPANAALIRLYTDDALKALRRALGAGWKNLGDLRNDPDLDPIRDDPGFVAIFEEFRKAAAP